MRETKYRAWDTVNKVMGEVVELRLGLLQGVDVKYKSSRLKASGGIYGKPFILLQYIGIEDKDGKDIYDGDILGYEEDTGLDVKSSNHIVKYYPGRFSTTAIKPSLYWKIIGNIYENPELIGK
jgi:hypothetical protein